MKKIAIICNLDGFANSEPPLAQKKYFEKKGHHVVLVNTHYFSRLKNKHRVDYVIPAKKIHILILFFLEAIIFFTQKYFLEGYKNYRLLMLSMKVRAHILSVYFKKNVFDVIICENLGESMFLLEKVPSVKIYNCATPYADELFFGGQLSKSDYLKFKSLEIDIYNSVDYLSFHWEAYAEYVKKHYHYHGNNIFKLNFGVNLKKIRAKFKYPLKIVYFGYLGGYWINLPLLSKLTRIYKNIDVYGHPVPDQKYRLNYKGYANSKVLSKYQFGLITITKDQLRKEGFSGKHIDYLSYGLPVLTPKWRKDAVLDDVSVYYDEQDFLKVVNSYSKKNEWEKASNLAYKKAKLMSWNKVLKPLGKIIDKQ